MVDWFLQLPRRILVVILIGTGIVLIVLWNPPATVCGAQIEGFAESTKYLLQIDPKKKAYRKETEYDRLYNTCLSNGTPGGCYEYFHNVHKIIKVAQTLSAECLPDLGQESQFKKVLSQTMELMVRLAWGSKPPVSVTFKSGWLNAADLAMFCDMRKTQVLSYGESGWTNFVGKMLKDLPGSTGMTREDIWAKTIMSSPCN